MWGFFTRGRLSEVAVEGKGEGYLIRVQCPICLGTVEVELTPRDIRAGTDAVVSCPSGLDTFRLVARFDPLYAGDPDGVYIWGYPAHKDSV